MYQKYLKNTKLHLFSLFIFTVMFLFSNVAIYCVIVITMHFTHFYMFIKLVLDAAVKNIVDTYFRITSMLCLLKLVFQHIHNRSTQLSLYCLFTQIYVSFLIITSNCLLFFTSPWILFLLFFNYYYFLYCFYWLLFEKRKFLIIKITDICFNCFYFGY